MQHFHDQDGLSKSYQSPFRLKNNGSKDNKSLRGERGSRHWLNRACHPDVAAGGLAVTGAWIGFGLFLIWLTGALVLIVRLLRAAGSLIGGGVLRGLGSGGPVFVGGALQVADAGLEFVDDAEVVGVADDFGLGLVGTAHDAGGLKVAGAELTEANAGEIESEGDREEGHGCGHGETRLQHVLAERTEAVGDASAEGKNLGGGEGRLADVAALADGGTEMVGGAEDDVGGFGGGLAAGFGYDAVEQGHRGFGPRGLQHRHPGGSALSVGEHGGATGAADHVEVESGLVGGGESAIEGVGEHGLTLCAVI